jgi:YD repeat-containing protein
MSVPATIGPDRVGTMLYTQRDVPARIGIAASRRHRIEPTMGRLGGPGVLEDPHDLGPAVPVPGGWVELFGWLAGTGFRTVEFAGYAQHPANPGGVARYAPTRDGRAAYLAYARRLRTMLDDAGLRAVGAHVDLPATRDGPWTSEDAARFATELEVASILGLAVLGTGDDPTTAADRTVEGWDGAAARWDAMLDISVRAGIRCYPHNHADAYGFIQDGPTVTVAQDRRTGDPMPPMRVRAESGIRLMERYLERTDPSRCPIELDVYWAHVAADRHRWRYDGQGRRVEDVFDPGSLITRYADRIALVHAKDGRRTHDPSGEGDGYSMRPFGDPDSGIDYQALLAALDPTTEILYEQDDAPGGMNDPGRSLRYSRLSAARLLAIVR